MKLISQKSRQSEEEVSQEEESEKNQSNKEKSFQKAKKKDKKSKQKSHARRKINNFLQKVTIKTDPQKFNRYSPKRYLCTINAIKTQKMTILKYRKPLTRKDLTLNRLNLNITATQVKRFCLTLKDT